MYMQHTYVHVMGIYVYKFTCNIHIKLNFFYIEYIRIPKVVGYSSVVECLARLLDLIPSSTKEEKEI